VVVARRATHEGRNTVRYRPDLVVDGHPEETAMDQDLVAPLLD
jgi:hypothetical protein